jgi:hypothetical protein
MHRGGVPFVSPDVFKNVYWATVKPIIQELWADGIQTLFYAEGKWDRHLESFAELPDRSIVYHVDQGDVARAHQVLGHKFCLSGGISNIILAHGSPADVRRRCKEVIDIAARDGGYIMDASAIVQNDAKVENIKAMTDFTREYGVYSSSGPGAIEKPRPGASSGISRPHQPGARPPGVCVPWDQKRAQLPPISGDEALVKRVWEEIDGLANMYIWQILLSF